MTHNTTIGVIQNFELMKHLSKYTRQKLKKMYAGGDTVEQIASKTGLKIWQVTIAVLNKKIITKSN